ncbi:type IX secretion system plug protein [Parapedobacter lycopersici]|uniref:type IX secretion system plug protein n=1 Tax=Parapedobacter lycopersici TaxID=1864939 RepID=UPI00214DBB37|nr:type IX secretion system plug protein domain-containing protein [Parapedobacter lycopersici]
MRKIALVLLLVHCCGLLSAQKQKKRRASRERSPQQELVYDNINYLPVIRTVQLYPAEQENALPVIELHSNDQLELAFDDLRGDIRNYYLSMEHCDANWKPSRLSPLEYASGFNEERVMTYESSVNTLQPYTHYRASFPTENMRPKLAGNYLLKVYEDADKSRLVISRRFYVVAPLMIVAPELIPSFDVAKRRSNQKLNLRINTGGLTVSNPYQDVKVLVMQNQRPDVQEWLTSPQFVNGNELTYQDNRTLDFGGGNEFRYIDLRSLRLASERMADIAIDSTARVNLVPDINYRTAAYASVFDENGGFFIRNQDKASASAESDYIEVTFTLEDREQVPGTIYVVGGFNNYRREPANQLTLRPGTGSWQATLLLKQGVYDYEYVLATPAGGVDPAFFSGNHFETGNTYQILVYNRRPGTTWDELVGYTEVDTESATRR